jgi:hypothetical protein
MSESNIQASPGSIFICYRREDSADVTGRIYDRLVDHFGPERVFMDVEAIRLGYDFRSEIDQTIKVCSIVIIVIGDKWLAEADGKRRIDDENDRVRIEIESALRREIPIIPVLTRGASHPTKAMLPSSLEALAYRHGTSIRHEHFRGDVDSLISQMDKLLARKESTPSKTAEPKESTTPIKSTQRTQSQPAIPRVASISAIAASKEPAVWTRKRLIIVTAGGAAVMLLFTITVLLMRPHRGDAAAQFNLGVQYEYGRGVPKDLGKAAQLFEKAANIGYAPAQYNLGRLYQNGDGVPKDLGKAAELYRKAANQGDQDAIASLKRLSRPAEPKLTDQGDADAPSTNIDKPTLLTSNEIRGNGVGENISYYYTFNAGPGTVKVTVDGKNKPGVANAIRVKISDLDAKELLSVSIGNTTIDQRQVARFELGRRQQVIIRILLHKLTADYMVRLEGPIDLIPTTKVPGPQ